MPDCLQHLLPHRDAVLFASLIPLFPRRALLRLSILVYTFAAILFSLLCYSFLTRLTYEEVPCAWPVSFKHPRIN